MPPTHDYSIYLVTDSTMVPSGSTFISQIQDAIDNGATMVQLREKNLSTLDFVERAKQVLEITKPRSIPLIINDRIDVALAVDADGVHVGQDDMPAATARKLIGPSKILGVSCTQAAEVERVCEESVADYVGLGTLYPTSTKDVKNVCGPLGIRNMLRILGAKGNGIKSVAIGGINQDNASYVRFSCQVPTKSIDGIAVVSCIMASNKAGTATADLVAKFNSSVAWHKPQLHSAPQKWDFSKKPLVHHITNNVVKNFSANVTLAVGGSPIMSELPEEYAEFTSLALPGSLVINLGTPSSDLLKTFVSGLRTYNAHNKPVLFDPVAAGASKARLEACRNLLNAGHFTVIKGNVGEIMALYSLTGLKMGAKSSSEPCMQGVDSVADVEERHIKQMGEEISTELKNIVVVTGKRNYVFDGTVVPVQMRSVEGGHPLMGSVTGTGCSLGSVIAAYLAVADFHKFSKFEAVAEALTLYNEAGAVAGQRSDGPGSFSPNFLDALHKMTKMKCTT